MKTNITRSIGGLVAGATTLSIAGAALGAGGESIDTASQIAELKAANAALAAKVEKLERGANGEEWLTEQRASEIRAIVSDVLADASVRDSLQASGATAGWNKDQGGFFMASPSGDFKLNLRGQVQVRWAYNNRDNSGLGATAAKEGNWGFENRRTKLTFTGFVIDPSWTYEVKLVANRATGTVTGATYSANNIVGSVEEIFVQKDFGNGMMLRAGQFKAPFIREELVSSASQLTVERSLVNDVFSTKFAQGLQAEFGGRAGEQWRAGPWPAASSISAPATGARGATSTATSATTRAG